MKLINSNRRKSLQKGEIYFFSKPTYVGKFIIRTDDTIIGVVDQITYGDLESLKEAITIVDVHQKRAHNVS